MALTITTGDVSVSQESVSQVKAGDNKGFITQMHKLNKPTCLEHLLTLVAGEWGQQFKPSQFKCSFQELH